MKSIKFYRVKDPFGCFSNFASYPVTIDGVVWPTSEHYFQAQKFKDESYKELIRAVNSPKMAAQMGRDPTRGLRQDWEEVKNGIMYRAVLAKFMQHPELQLQLLSTGDAFLIEHTRNDSYWGDNGDGSGKNMLGHILMRVRSVLR